MAISVCGGKKCCMYEFVCTQVVTKEIFQGTVEEELGVECGRNKPNVLKLQRCGGGVVLIVLGLR